MADRATKRRKNKDEKVSEGDDKATKLEKKVAHWLRRNVQTKKTKFMQSHDVSFFIGSRVNGAGTSIIARFGIYNLRTTFTIIKFV